MVSDAVALTQQRVQRILSDLFGSVRVMKDGAMLIAHESAAVIIEVREFLEHTVVKASAPMLREVPFTDELCRWAAVEGQDRWFASARLYVNEDRSMCEIAIEQDLLGDTIDPDELKIGVMSVLFAANAFDDELQQRFGGLRWVDTDD